MGISPLPQTLQIDQESIHLKELIDRLNQLDLEMQNLEAKLNLPPDTPQEPRPDNQLPLLQNEATISKYETIEMEFSFWPAQRVNGFIVHNKCQSESDRYIFMFNINGTDFTIVDKWTKRGTRIWGDPHIDLDGVDKDRNGEFSDRKASNSNTTFMIMDGTRVTVKAKDNAMIEEVDLIKDNQHIHATGQASENWTSSGSFDTQVRSDGILSDTLISRGNTIFAGGDGSEWFNASGHLVWGRATSSIVTAAPSHKLDFLMNQTATESLSIHRIEKSV
jgi:hypothetical protein